MARNGISTLTTREQRQVAKLIIATSNSKSQTRAKPDMSLMPTRYSGNQLIFNPIPENGWPPGRPFVSKQTVPVLDITTGDISPMLIHHVPEIIDTWIELSIPVPETFDVPDDIEIITEPIDDSEITGGFVIHTGLGSASISSGHI